MYNEYSKKSDQRLDKTKTVDHTFMRLGQPFKVFSLVLYVQQEPSQLISEDYCRSGEYFSALNLQLSCGPARVKISLQPLCPSEEETAKSHMQRGLDCWVGGATFGRAVLQATELLPLLCGD